MQFAATKDTLVKGITVGVLLLLSGILLVLLFDEKDWQLLLLLIAVFGLIVLLTYMFMPLGYRIQNQLLVIERPFRSVEIPLQTITEVHMPQPGELSFSLRVFGSGGFFGYFGRFWNKRFGHMHWYATRRSNYVLLRTANRVLVLTPDNPAEMVQALSAQANLPQKSS